MIDLLKSSEDGKPLVFKGVVEGESLNGLPVQIHHVPSNLQQAADFFGSYVLGHFQDIQGNMIQRHVLQSFIAKMKDGVTYAISEQLMMGADLVSHSNQTFVAAFPVEGRC